MFKAHISPKILSALKRYYSWAIVGIAVILYLFGRHLYFEPGHSVGDVAPTFSSTLVDGTWFELDQLHGKYTLLDFWGSWCGPCIDDFPAFSEIYNRYHTARFHDATGFEIVGIGVEQSAERWRLALARLAPEWPYQVLDTVSSLRFFDGKLTHKFGVKRIPAAILLDPEGKIIGTHLSTEKIDAILASKLIR